MGFPGAPRGTGSGWPIRAKLSLIFTLLVVGLTLFIVLYVPRRLEEQALASLADKARSVAAITAFGVGPALYFGDPAAAAPALESARQSPDVTYVVVTSRSGRVTTIWNLEGSDASGFREADGGDGPSRRGDVYRAMAPVVYDGHEVGRLYLGLSLAPLHAETARSRRAAMATGAAVFLLGVAAVLLLSQLLTRPLLAVVRTVQEIAAGDFSRRAPVTTRDEVGLLARSFNQMVGSLEAAYHEKESLNRELERRVEERTAALAESETRYALAARGTNDGLWDWDLRSDRLYLSPRWRAMVGLPGEAAAGEPSAWCAWKPRRVRERWKWRMRYPAGCSRSARP